MNRCVLIAMFVLTARLARGEGVTDFVIDPATGYSIAASGAYRLTSDVSMSGDATAIDIAVDNVTIDLGGHTIRGASGSSKSGISTSGASRVTISNGRIMGFGSWGIDLGATFSGNCVLRDCTAAENNLIGDGGGIRVGNGCTVERCMASNNDPITGPTYGIFAGADCRVIECSARSNTSADSDTRGIQVGVGSIVEGCIASSNRAGGAGRVSGIEAGAGCLVRRNVCQANASLGTGNATGITAIPRCVIEANTCAGQSLPEAATGAVAAGIETSESTVINNDCGANAVVSGNCTAYGISGGSGSLIQGNRCSRQSAAGTGIAAGINVLNNCRVVENYCYFNVGGVRSHGIRCAASGHFVAGNSCQGNGTGGIIFASSANNRSESNRLRQTTGIDTLNGFSPASEGAGDLADVTY